MSQTRPTLVPTRLTTVAVRIYSLGHWYFLAATHAQKRFRVGHARVVEHGIEKKKLRTQQNYDLGRKKSSEQIVLRPTTALPTGLDVGAAVPGKLPRQFCNLLIEFPNFLFETCDAVVRLDVVECSHDGCIVL